MYIGLLQFEILVRSSDSLKDKRRVVRSVRDRLHREHQCSVAEIGALDHHRLALMGLAVVSNAAPRCGEILDVVTHKLRTLREGELGELKRSVCSLTNLEATAITEAGDPKLDDAETLERDLLRRGLDAANTTEGNPT